MTNMTYSKQLITNILVSLILLALADPFLFGANSPSEYANTTWVFIGDAEEGEVMPDRLLLNEDGFVFSGLIAEKAISRGEWEYLPERHSLLLRFKDNSKQWTKYLREVAKSEYYKFGVLKMEPGANTVELRVLAEPVLSPQGAKPSKLKIRTINFLGWRLQNEYDINKIHGKKMPAKGS